ncbi:MAG TPA: peptidylprolyl isomerase [Terriglobales bacterium]|nr:peptidylprolyl isomerase [Terriglobales bacterium]
MNLFRLSCFLCLTLGLSAQTVVEEIVARVNNEIITTSDLKRSREQVRTELQQQGATDVAPQMSQKEKDLLRDLIDQQLLVQRGKDEGITAETDVIKRLDEIRKSMNLETMEDLEKAAQQQGVSFEDFKSNLRNGIITQQVIGQEVGRKLNITPTEVATYYEQHKKEFSRPEQVELAEILVSTEPAPSAQKDAPPPAEDPAKLAAAEAKAKQVLESIRAGAKFEDVAKKESNGPTAAQGGELGAFTRGSLAKELEDKTFAMKDGEVSDVIRTKQGFIILKVLRHQQAGLPPLKEVENKIYETIYYERLQPALRQFLTKLREEAFIDVKQGYVDSGASPNQTKPVITDVASAETKDKTKKKKKFLLF